MIPRLCLFKSSASSTDCFIWLTDWLTDGWNEGRTGQWTHWLTVWLFDRWKEGRIDQSTDWLTDRRMEGRMDRPVDWLTDWLTDRRKDVQTSRLNDWQKDRRTDGRKDVQASGLTDCLTAWLNDLLQTHRPIDYPTDWRLITGSGGGGGGDWLKIYKINCSKVTLNSTNPFLTAPPCSAGLDIGIVLDKSRSVKIRNLRKIIASLVELVDSDPPPLYWVHVLRWSPLQQRKTQEKNIRDPANTRASNADWPGSSLFQTSAIEITKEGYRKVRRRRLASVTFAVHDLEESIYPGYCGRKYTI